MADNLTTPIPSNIVMKTKDTGSGHASAAFLVGADGADAMGGVVASPAPTTLLGRLKAIADAVLGKDTGAAATAGGVVTPSDSTALSGVRAIYVGGAGNIVATVGGVDLTFTAVPAGATLAIAATKVKAATTATNIVWLG